jgi:hypothetical protein
MMTPPDEKGRFRIAVFGGLYSEESREKATAVNRAVDNGDNRGGADDGESMPPLPAPLKNNLWRERKGYGRVSP